MDMKLINTEGITDHGGIESLVAGYTYGRYCEDNSLARDASQRLVCDRLVEYLESPGARQITAVTPGGETLGSIAFKISPWDSDHFGFNSAIIDTLITRRLGYEQELEIADALVKEFNAWCQSTEVRFITAKVPSKDLPVVHALEHNGFNFIESWIFNKYDLNHLDEASKPTQALRLARPEDRELMIEYSHEAFATQRFHADANIPHDKADSLYEKWILTAFADPHQEVLVLDSGNRPAGFMIYYPVDLRPYFGLQFAQWKMALLDPQSRGKGLGTLFFTALFYHHRDSGLDVIDSGLSIRNITSLNLHTKLNFKVTCTLVTLHEWLDPS